MSTIFVRRHELLHLRHDPVDRRDDVGAARPSPSGGVTKLTISVTVALTVSTTSATTPRIDERQRPLQRTKSGARSQLIVLMTQGFVISLRAVSPSSFSVKMSPRKSRRPSMPALHPAGPTPHMHDESEPILIGNESGIDDPMMVLSDGRSPERPSSSRSIVKLKSDWMASRVESTPRSEKMSVSARSAWVASSSKSERSVEPNAALYLPPQRNCGPGGTPAAWRTE